MAKIAEKADEKLSEAQLRVVLDELGSDTLTFHRMAELLQMLPPARVTPQSSADIIRELRGPLPGDE